MGESIKNIFSLLRSMIRSTIHEENKPIFIAKNQQSIMHKMLKYKFLSNKKMFDITEHVPKNFGKKEEKSLY